MWVWYVLEVIFMRIKGQTNPITYTVCSICDTPIQRKVEQKRNVCKKCQIKNQNNRRKLMKKL